MQVTALQLYESLHSETKLRLRKGGIIIPLCKLCWCSDRPPLIHSHSWRTLKLVGLVPNQNKTQFQNMKMLCENQLLSPDLSYNIVQVQLLFFLFCTILFIFCWGSKSVEHECKHLPKIKHCLFILCFAIALFSDMSTWQFMLIYVMIIFQNY